jgi:hypothetical protein
VKNVKKAELLEIDRKALAEGRRLVESQVRPHVGAQPDGFPSHEPASYSAADAVQAPAA